MLLFRRLDPRLATLLRLAGLGLIAWSIFRSQHAPGTSGRGLAVTVLFALAAVTWLVWMAQLKREHGVTPDLYVLAGVGGLLCGACPDSAAAAFVFVAVVSAGMRAGVAQGLVVVAVGTLGLAIAVIVYGGGALGLVAYALGFTAALLAGSNARQYVVRAEQAELLLAQTQRSHEEQLRGARLQEAARIARDIHDVLAHTLAGLTIQLEATNALLSRGAGRDVIAARIGRAHELAREGLVEARRAVSALRADQNLDGQATAEPVSTGAAIEGLVADYRASANAPASLTVDGDPDRLPAATGQAVVRVAQEALTNVRKHAPGATVTVRLDAGREPGEDVVLVIDDQPATGHTADPASALATSGGGFGLQGMRERAQLLGGTLRAGGNGGGWRVELRLPLPRDAGGERRPPHEERRPAHEERAP